MHPLSQDYFLPRYSAETHISFLSPQGGRTLTGVRTQPRPHSARGPPASRGLSLSVLRVGLLPWCWMGVAGIEVREVKEQAPGHLASQGWK